MNTKKIAIFVFAMLAFFASLANAQDFSNRGSAHQARRTAKEMWESSHGNSAPVRAMNSVQGAGVSAASFYGGLHTNRQPAVYANGDTVSVQYINGRDMGRDVVLVVYLFSATGNNLSGSSGQQYFFPEIGQDGYVRGGMAPNQTAPIYQMLVGKDTPAGEYDVSVSFLDPTSMARIQPDLVTNFWVYKTGPGGEGYFWFGNSLGVSFDPATGGVIGTVSGQFPSGMEVAVLMGMPGKGWSMGGATTSPDGKTLQVFLPVSLNNAQPGVVGFMDLVLVFNTGQSLSFPRAFRVPVRSPL